MFGRASMDSPMCRYQLKGAEEGRPGNRFHPRGSLRSCTLFLLCVLRAGVSFEKYFSSFLVRLPRRVGTHASFAGKPVFPCVKSADVSSEFPAPLRVFVFAYDESRTFVCVWERILYSTSIGRKRGTNIYVSIRHAKQSENGKIILIAQQEPKNFPQIVKYRFSYFLFLFFL